MEIAILGILIGLQSLMFIEVNIRYTRLKQLIDVIGRYLAIKIILEEKENDKKKSD